MTRLYSLAVLAFAMLGLGLSAQAVPVVYTTMLDGASEAPPNTSPATGSATITLDLAAQTLRVQFDFADLEGTTTAAHIHGPTAVPGTGTAGVMTMTPFFTGMPIGVTSGSYDMTFDTSLASTFNASFVTAQGSVAAAEAAFAASLAAGTAYFNLHTTQYPGGEIRGFLQPAAVPAPGVLGLLLAGGLGLMVTRRTR